MFQRKRVYLVLIILINYTLAIKPPGYVEKPKEPDPNPPKYEYGYSVANNDDAGSQGHKETRDGDNTKGNYFVNLPLGQANSNVQYIADDWGYHPVVRYATQDDHSRVSGHFALGHSAVQALQLDPLHHNESPNNFIQLQTDQYTSPESLQLVGVPPANKPLNQQILLHFPTNHQFPGNDPPNINHEKDPKVTYMQPVNEPQNDNQSVNDKNDPYNTNSGLNKLLENTQNLVSNKDVIDINEAVEYAPKPLFTPTLDDQYNAASNGQKQALELNQRQQQPEHESDTFNGPIVVNDENSLSSKPSGEVNIVPNLEYLPQKQEQQRLDKQINVQIINANNGQYLKETTHFDAQKSQHIDDQKLMDSVVFSQKEAPSRQFLRNFKGNKILSPSQESNAIYSTTSSTTQTTSKSYTKEEISVTQSPISTKFLAPIQAGLRLSNDGKHIDDCLDLVRKEPLTLPLTDSDGSINGKKTIVEVQKSINIKNILISQEHEKPKQQAYSQQVFGARFIPKKPKIIQQNVYIDRPYPVEVNKYIEKPVRVEVPVHIDRIVEKPVPYPVAVEKIVERPVERIVEKQVQGPVQKVFIEKPIHHTHYQPYEVTKTERIPVPYVVEKFVDRPVTVEKIVEKIIDRPVEVEKIVERPYKEVVQKFIDRPYPVEVEKIVEKEVKIEVPVEKIVEKIVDRPVPVEVHIPIDRPYPVPFDRPYPVEVEKIVEKFIDRPIPYAVHVPYPVPYAVQVPQKQHHTIIKTTTSHDHGKGLFHKNHKSTNHIFLPNPPSNHHYSSNLIQSPEISSAKHNIHLQSIPTNHHLESTVLKPIHSLSDQLSPPSPIYNSNLKPKPIYGVPFFGHAAKTTHLFPKHLNYDNQYAGSFDYQSHIYKDDYLGPPPSFQTHIWSYSETPKFRRNINFGKSLRWEYGFKPPLVPSIEIGIDGSPLKKENN